MAYTFNPFIANLDYYEPGGGGGGAVDSVNGQTGTVVLTTSDITEGTNLYYTATRFNTAFAAKTTTDLTEGTNLYYTAARFNIAFASKTTTDLTEGTNLYYTAARFDSAFATKTTDDLTEGVTNLYFHDSFITRDPNTFAGFDGTGLLETIPSWAIDGNTGGANVQINLAPANPGGGQTWVFENFTTSITPTEAIPNQNFQGMQLYTYLNGPNDFANYINLNSGVALYEAGNHGGVTLINQDVQMGDNTNVSSSENLSLQNETVQINNQHTVNQGIQARNVYLHVNAGGTVTNYLNGDNLNIQVDDDISATVQLYSASFNLNANMTGGAGFNHFNMGSNIAGTLQYVNGFQINTNYQTGSNVTQGIQAFADNTNHYGSITHGITSFTSNLNFDVDCVLVNGYGGVNISPNIYGDMTGAGFNGGNFGGNFYGPMDYLNGMNVNPQFRTGSSVVNGITVFQDSTQVETGVTANYYTGCGLFPNFNAGSAINSIQLLNVSPNYAATGGVGSQLYLANMFANGGGTVEQLTGINIGLNGVNSPNKKYIFQGNDGSFNSNYELNTGTITVGLAESVNSIGGTFHIAAGSPLTGGEFVFGNLFSVQGLFEDDMGPDVIGGVIGYSQCASVGQTAILAGKTVDTYNMMTTGASIPTFPGDGGTFTNFVLYRGIGLLPAGGALNITNMYGLKIDSFLTAMSPTNAWGVSVEDPNADNFFYKLAIGTTSKKTTTGWQLEVENSSILNGGLQVQQVSTAFNYIMDDNTIKDNVALIDTSGMSVVVFLPSPSSGRLATVKDTTGNASTNNIVINSGGANIDGVSGATISTDFGVMRFISDGTNWFVI